MRRLAPALILALLVWAAPAQAGPRQVRIFQDDRMLIYSGPAVRAAVLDSVRAMGVDVIRAQFVWRNIALSKPRDPGDPAAYGSAWSNWDSLVIEARKRGMKVLATITGPAPSWAAGKTGKFFEGSRYPDAKAFGQFVAAVGRRYSGRAKAATTRAGAGRTDAGTRARSAQLLEEPLTEPLTETLTGTLEGTLQGGLLEPVPCTPVPPLITCSPEGPVIGPAPSEPAPTPTPSSPPPPESGEQSPPPPPGSGTPTPPPPAGTTIPRIDLWSVYNEPNHPLFLSPQRRRGVLVAPSLYRKLYRAAWRSLARTGHRRDTILIGETLPIGSNQNRETSTTSPLTFARELFCLNGRGRKHPGCNGRFAKLRATGWALHPYYRRTGPFSRPPGRDDLTPAAVGRLRTLLARAGRRGRVSRGLDLWDTENGSQTRPPDPKGASLARQARFINEAEYLAWRKPYLRSFSQYLMTDEEPVWAFQSGLFFRDGSAKPALGAYHLPIHVRRAGRGVVVWGRIPPGGDRRVTIVPSRGRAVTMRVRARNGYFSKRLRRRASRYQLRYGGFTSRTATPS